LIDRYENENFPIDLPDREGLNLEWNKWDITRMILAKIVGLKKAVLAKFKPKRKLSRND
jgi:hypothetical protein